MRTRRVAATGMALGLAAIGAGTGASRGAQAPDTRPVPVHPNLHYWQPVQGTPHSERMTVDICVYGGTSAGVVAAIEAARHSKSVVLVAPEQHLGGLTTGGLTNTDIGNKAAIGGISREFYKRVGQKYGELEERRFEPKVAEQVYREMIEEAHVPVRYGQFLKSIEKDHRRVVYLTTQAGLTVTAREFIDATYEGDLLAKAGVKYTVGREANSVYHETVDGVQVRDKHQFEHPVSPYVVEDDPKSGLLPGIEPGPIEAPGSGDPRVQAYNFRMTLTTNPENRIPFARPVGYDPQQYVLLARYLKTGWNEVFRKFDPIHGGKVDTNNHGAVSTDFIGQNYDYPNADYATREKIFQKHVVYQQGLMWFLANDPSVPEAIRTKMSGCGLCKDEFTDTGGWPRQLYVREARRMLSDYVMTEANCRGQIKAEDPVGLAAYTMDSHNCRRFVKDGRVWNEGDVQVGGSPPYPISYRSIMPRARECENLLVPVCLSASHIAYGSIRMEPVFMILGQSAAAAASMAVDADVPVQKIDVSQLQERLLFEGQILEWKSRAR